MSNFPIPTKIFLQNFGSHKNTILTFGELMDRCYITGSSGSGKSHILNALQYVLGRKIERDNEFFTFEEIDDGGVKRKVYKNHAKIELTVLNTGPDALNQYPIDEKVIIGLEAFKGKKRRNRRYIKIRGEERRITKEELKNFGDWNDPLVFIDDQQTVIWTQKSPKERYNAVSRFIGIEDYKDKVSAARNELNEANKKLEDANKRLRELHLKFQTIEGTYKRFQKKKEFEKFLAELKLNQLKAKIHHTFNYFNEIQEKFFSIYENNEKLSDEIEKLRNEIKSITQKISNIETKFQTQQVEKEELIKKIDDLKYKIREFTTSYEAVISYLDTLKISFPEISNLIEIGQQKKKEEQELEEFKANMINLQKKLEEYNISLKEIEKEKFVIPAYISKIQKRFKEKNIPSELLFETLEFKKGTENWHDYIENILAYNKIGLVVKEEDGRLAEEINRDLNSNAIILSPRKRYVLKGKKGLRDWSSIIEICPQLISSETIENLMDLMMRGLYFANSVKEKEQFLIQAPYSKIFCQDEYTYNIYSQRKFYFTDTSYMIGKGAIEKEKNRIVKHIESLNNKITKLKSGISGKKQMLELVNKKLEYIDLKNKQTEIDIFEKEKIESSKRLDELHSILAFPQQNIERLNENIERSRRNIEEKRNSIEENHLELTSLILELNNLADDFINYVERIDILESIEFENESIILVENYTIDDNYKYKGINKEANQILSKIEKPVETVEYFNKEILKAESALDQYQDVDSSIVKLYDDTRNNIQTLDGLNHQFEIEKDECQNRFLITVSNLRDKLLKWQDIVSKRYKSIMIGLNLDGELKFNETEIEGDYQLSINVSNAVGGSLDPIEYSNFSKGERLRASIAFEMSILAESSSSFSVWDEFDQNIADDHKELLALVIEKHLPEKKLICISPYTPTPGYIRIFPNIIHIWKNQNKESQITLINFDQEVKKAGDLTDAIKQN